MQRVSSDDDNTTAKKDVVYLAKIANIITDYASKYHNTQIGAQLHIVAAHMCSAIIMLDDKQ